jgi:hypothetical protein
VRLPFGDGVSEREGVLLGRRMRRLCRLLQPIRLQHLQLGPRLLVQWLLRRLLRVLRDDHFPNQLHRSRLHLDLDLLRHPERLQGARTSRLHRTTGVCLGHGGRRSGRYLQGDRGHLYLSNDEPMHVERRLPDGQRIMFRSPDQLLQLHEPERMSEPFRLLSHDTERVLGIDR